MQKVWNSRLYYNKAKEGSQDLDHPGMKLILKLARSSVKILDLGCGEGTRLKTIAGKKKTLVGVDVSSTAIKMAVKNNPRVKFYLADLTNLPFADNDFDLVYSAYVFEHLIDPVKSLKEAVRVTGKNLVIIAPNYGSPNRSSPNYKKSRIKKFLKGVLLDFYGKTIESWERVDPTKNADYRMDNDTVIEPHILPLINTLRNMGMVIKYWDTCWSYELPNAKTHQRIFRILAGLKIFPFKYWGPHLVVYAVKP